MSKDKQGRYTVETAENRKWADMRDTHIQTKDGKGKVIARGEPLTLTAAAVALNEKV